MRFRPCIDIHNGQVKQIVGGSLSDSGLAVENFVSGQDAAFYARMYNSLGLKGGHVIILNARGTAEYDASLEQALNALKAAPGTMQIGGGITPDNAKAFLDAGASHVIVTSYVFSGGEINYDNLEKMLAVTGKQKLVLDLSCRKKDGDYYIVTDRWQKMTDVKVCEETLDKLSEKCDEFLVHAVDVEGKQSGIEEELAGFLGKWAGIPITYAGGVHNSDDLYRLKTCGEGRIDVTVGSALEIFGGTMTIEDVIKACAE